ncbi:hypothetical protein C7M84_001016 [Penaeus vannamei]|uniref:Uncharacterized protein n=1 Tax=Penaeus vannamei TaxID=6689 RepID=A0A3R7MLS8_PENVA|nr:hypothetical protein C7M84_001016 [Penaeus vannamei]
MRTTRDKDPLRPRPPPPQRVHGTTCGDMPRALSFAVCHRCLILLFLLFSLLSCFPFHFPVFRSPNKLFFSYYPFLFFITPPLPLYLHSLLISFAPPSCYISSSFSPTSLTSSSFLSSTPYFPHFSSHLLCFVIIAIVVVASSHLSEPSFSSFPFPRLLLSTSSSYTLSSASSPSSSSRNTFPSPKFSSPHLPPPLPPPPSIPPPLPSPLPAIPPLPSPPVLFLSFSSLTLSSFQTLLSFLYVLLLSLLSFLPLSCSLLPRPPSHSSSFSCSSFPSSPSPTSSSYSLLPLSLSSFSFTSFSPSYPYLYTSLLLPHPPPVFFLLLLSLLPVSHVLLHLFLLSSSHPFPSRPSLPPSTLSGPFPSPFSSYLLSSPPSHMSAVTPRGRVCQGRALPHTILGFALS